MDREPGDGKGEGLALASIISASLVFFPGAVLFGVTALYKLKPKNGYRSVARWAVIIGVLEGGIAGVLLGFILLHDPFPGRRRAAKDQMFKIFAAQNKFKTELRLDRDGDGVGEFGLLQELASGPRPLVSRVFETPTAKNYVEKYGYYFIVFLPGRDWRDASAGPKGGADSGNKVVDAREEAWIAYAWPAVRGRTARGLLVATSKGVFESNNERACYNGEAKLPRPFGALNGYDLESTVPVESGSSMDGERWERLRSNIPAPSE
ncbi:MAG: hypothetical protein ACYTFG_16435 [Planctomycetota bacterium]|jgi:hypothetical protein